MTTMTVKEFKAWFDGIMDVIDDFNIDRSTLTMIQTKLATVVSADNSNPFTITYPVTKPDFTYLPHINLPGLEKQSPYMETTPWWTSPTYVSSLGHTDHIDLFSSLN